MKKGKLLIISGFSGVGKGTVVKYLAEHYSNYKVSVSATTRNPREGEENGIHYFFITKDNFEDMISNNQLLEYAYYVGNYYGTPKEYVENHLNNGDNVILEIETVGALKVKSAMPEAIMIFVMPPSANILKDRLVGRHTETEEVIKERLIKASKEIEVLDNYEYFVINDEIDKCAINIDKIANGDPAELLSEDQVDAIKKDIMIFSKGE